MSFKTLKVPITLHENPNFDKFLNAGLNIYILTQPQALFKLSLFIEDI